MKIYTRTGDQGETGLFGGPRVFKDDPRIDAYGTIDELNAAIGVVRATPLPSALDAVLESIQNDLFTLGAQLATPDPEAKGVPMLREANVAALETTIDDFESKLRPLTSFILPGGTPAAAALHVARGVCRRAERLIVSFVHSNPRAVSPPALAYVNRLSDLLFVLARVANAVAGRGDVPWKKP